MFIGGKVRIWNNNGKWFNLLVEGYWRRRGSFNLEIGKKYNGNGMGSMFFFNYK